MVKTVDSENRNIVVATRLKPSTFKLLDHLSSHTKIRKSMLIRAALTQWLQNALEGQSIESVAIEVNRVLKISPILQKGKQLMEVKAP